MEMTDELRNWRQDQFDGWSQETQQAIEDPHNPLRYV